MDRCRWFNCALITIGFLFLGACASNPKKEASFISPSAAAVPDSRISINYHLRHNYYLFQMQSGGAGVYTAKSTVNEKVIENRPVSREKYIAFANRVYDFAEKYNGSVATQDDCKSPFTIRMEKAGAVKDVQGCRGSDETGELGKIIREGEILFYSE